MTGDEFLQTQLQTILQPGEQVLLTNRRLIFIRTKQGFWKGGPQQQNLGIEEYDVRNLRLVTTSGIANNRSMTFHMHQGPSQTLRISPWFKQVLGTKQFLEQVPQIIASGQLASGQLPPGAPQQQLMAPQQHAQMPQQHQQVPQQHQQVPQQHQQVPQQHQQVPQHQPQQHQQMQQQPTAPQPFQAGQPVTVSAQDGNHYPATIMQAANGQYLCQMPNGQPYWFPAQVVTPR